MGIISSVGYLVPWRPIELYVKWPLPIKFIDNFNFFYMDKTLKKEKGIYEQNYKSLGIVF